MHNTFLHLNTGLKHTALSNRLVQIFAFNKATNIIHELMYLGFEYGFKYINSMDINNINNNFYIKYFFKQRNIISKKLLYKEYYNLPVKNLKFEYFNIFTNFLYNLNFKLNPIQHNLIWFILTGAKSNFNQLQQLIGYRGYVQSIRDFLVNTPILHNFESGLNYFDFIISCYGARKGLLDTSLNTSESGYLTRRLVEVIQDNVIKEKDCGSNVFFIGKKVYNIKGDLINLDVNMLVGKYFHIINDYEFLFKSVIFCNSGRSVCSKCLGFFFNKDVLKGESVGVIAGELIGEPSTQLTLQTFHTGGVFTSTSNKDNVNVDNMSNDVFGLDYNYFNLFNKYYFKLSFNNDFKIIKSKNSVKCLQFKCSIKKNKYNTSITSLFFNKKNELLLNDKIGYNYFIANKHQVFKMHPIEKYSLCNKYLNLLNYNKIMYYYSLYYLICRNINNEWVFINLLNAHAISKNNFTINIGDKYVSLFIYPNKYYCKYTLYNKICLIS